MATITINIAFGDNGLIKRAQQARDLYANESASELDVLNEVDEYLKEKIKKATSPDTPVEPVIPYTNVYVTLYEEGVLGFSNDESKIEGLTPIDGKTWDITESTFSANFNVDYEPYYSATTPWFGDRESIKRVVFSNEIVPKSVTALLMGCTNLTTIEGIENLNTTNVSNMSAMFDDCISLQSIDVSHFNTSNVTDMYSMFEGYSDYMALTEIIGLEQLDTSKVTDMSCIFRRCSSLENLDVSKFDTSKVTNMHSMFWGMRSLTSIDISNFDTSNVKYMVLMFDSCEKLDNIEFGPEFDTSNVTEMEYMFEYCYELEALDLSNFSTESAEDISGMFCECTSLSNITFGDKFTTEKVTNMSYLFVECPALTSVDISLFNTQKVTNMDEMFYGCSALTNILVGENWTTESATTTDMFTNCGTNKVTYKTN